MVCAPVRSIIPSLKLENYLSVQAHKPCSHIMPVHNLRSTERGRMKAQLYFQNAEAEKWVSSKPCYLSKVFFSIKLLHAHLQHVCDMSAKY